MCRFRENPVKAYHEPHTADADVMDGRFLIARIEPEGFLKKTDESSVSSRHIPPDQPEPLRWNTDPRIFRSDRQRYEPLFSSPAAEGFRGLSQRDLFGQRLGLLPGDEMITGIAQFRKNEQLRIGFFHKLGSSVRFGRCRLEPA